MPIALLSTPSVRAPNPVRVGVRPLARAAAVLPTRRVGASTRAGDWIASTPAHSFGSRVSPPLAPAAARIPSRPADVKCNASSAAAAEGEESEGGMGQTLLLGSLFGLWYLFNIFFNIYNKQVLKAFHFPFLCTNLQFAVGAVMALTMWGLRLHKAPTKEQITKEQLLKILPLACVHTLGNLLTNVSLGKVAVSFTHTIKAMEPFFSVMLSSIFLGDAPSMAIILSLLPIVGGVALASITEVSFNWMGFIAAMGSNLTFQSRNVLSKKFMGGKKPMDNINLFSVITIMSLFVLAPFTLATEGMKFTPGAMQAMGLDPAIVMKRALLAGLCFHSYQQVSYMILQRVSPVTHSVGNCVKRVVVIVASVIFFKTPVSAMNAVGTAIALSGVFLYSQVKRSQTAKLKAA